MLSNLRCRVGTALPPLPVDQPPLSPGTLPPESMFAREVHGHLLWPRTRQAHDTQFGNHIRILLIHIRLQVHQLIDILLVLVLILPQLESEVVDCLLHVQDYGSHLVAQELTARGQERRFPSFIAFGPGERVGGFGGFALAVGDDLVDFLPVLVTVSGCWICRWKLILCPCDLSLMDEGFKGTRYC